MKALLRWTGISLLILVVLAAIAAGVLAYLIMRLDMKSEIERAVERATGRDMTISGDVGVSYWPVLGIRAADASLANVQGGRAPALATMKDVAIGVELRPLLDRQVRVSSLVMTDPNIFLEVDAQGRPNWALNPPGQPTVADGQMPQNPQGAASQTPAEIAAENNNFSLRDVRIRGGAVHYFDARTNQGWDLASANLDTALTSLDTPMRIRGDIVFQTKPMKIDVSIGRPRVLMRGQSSPLQFEIESEILNASFEGETRMAAGEILGRVQASGPDLRAVSALFGAPIRDTERFQNFSVTGLLTVRDKQFAFNDAAFAVDELAGRGDFVLSERHDKPYISGRLELADADLNPYLPQPQGQTAPAPNTPAPQGQTAPTQQQAPTPQEPGRAVDFERPAEAAPLDLAGLSAINADLELIVHKLKVHQIKIDSGAMSLVVNDGYLAATLHRLALYGGQGRGRIEIDARQPQARFVEEITATGLNAQPFLADAINLNAIEGRAELSLNLRSEGASQAAMINSSDGRIHIEVVSGALHGVDLGGVSRTIRNALDGRLVRADARTPFQGFSATFDVADGVMASDSLSFNTSQLQVRGIGVIDLPQRRMDMRLAPRSPNGGIVIPFSVRGPFNAFEYNSDIRDRAKREIEARVRTVRAAARASR